MVRVCNLSFVPTLLYTSIWQPDSSPLVFALGNVTIELWGLG
jgi:hypothetical protein